MTSTTLFLTLGLTKDYHQLLINQESRKATSFSTPKGMYQCKMLPLGMKISGAFFQRIMGTIFKGLQTSKVVLYINNITVFLRTMELCLIDLDLVFGWLTKENLKVNFTICVLAQAEVKMLGHLIYNKRIRPNPAKIETISQMDASTDIAGVWSFMGLIIFYFQFISGVWTLVEPIWTLTRWWAVVDWNLEFSAAFE